MLKSGKEKFLLIFFISFSAFTFELLLTRIFSVLMWYHFASLAIGVAMLGLGGGGVLSYLLKDRISQSILNKSVKIYLVTFLLIHGFFFYFNIYPEKIVPFLTFFHQPYFQPFQRGIYFSFSWYTAIGILLAYMVITVPFFMAGFIISGIFRINAEDTKRLYYFDLLGASMSAFFVAIILNYVSPISLFSFISFFGFLILIPIERKGFFKYTAIFISLLLIFLSVMLKKDEIRIARGKVATNIIWSSWNTFSRVILYNLKGEEWYNPFGQSKYYQGQVPKQWGLLVDDTGYTVASEYSEKYFEFFRWNIISLPYLLNNKSALIIGPGGGKDILCAISMGVKPEDITAVELNPLIVYAVDDVLGKETGALYSKVKTYVAEGRSFLEKNKGMEKFDIIQATSVYGRIPPAAGIFTFAEDNLYTKEAFKTYFLSLKDNGLLSLSRFIYEQAVPKMILLSIESLRELGYASAESSIFIAKERGLAMVLAKKGIFSKEEIDRLMEYCNERGFDILYAPYYTTEGIYKDIIEKGSGSINLPNDDRPFYYYNLSSSDFIKSFFTQNDRFEERGIEILKFFVMASLIFVFFILFLPLIFKGGVKESKFLYHQKLVMGGFFFLLGVGYILIEIVFIKSFSLFLETPMYSMIFVTGAMLFSSALGSLFSIKINSSKNMIKMFMALILLLFFMATVINKVNNYLHLNLFFKAITAMGLVSFVGFFMGIPFPYMLSTVGKSDTGLLPWAVAINSGASVLGSFICLISVVNIGFTNSFYLGGFLYLLALLFFLIFLRSYEKNS